MGGWGVSGGGMSRDEIDRQDEGCSTNQIRDEEEYILCVRLHRGGLCQWGAGWGL